MVDDMVQSQLSADSESNQEKRYFDAVVAVLESFPPEVAAKYQLAYKFVQAVERMPDGKTFRIAFKPCDRAGFELVCRKERYDHTAESLAHAACTFYCVRPPHCCGRILGDKE